MADNVFIAHLQEKNRSESDSNSFCAFIVIAVVWTLLFFNIENDFFNYNFIAIVLGVNILLLLLFSKSVPSSSPKNNNFSIFITL